MSIPESRIEAILSDILGYEVNLEHPKSRVEKLLVALGALVENTPQLDNEGLIPISYLPPVAFADCITVQDQTERFALTTDDVQKGDTVYQNDTQVMYFVVDDTKLDQAAGYKALAAGIAAQAVADKDGNDITTTYLKSETYNAGKTVPQGTSVNVRGITYTVGAGAEIFNVYSGNQVAGNYSHAEGTYTAAIGDGSHAEGGNTIATKAQAHAEGNGTTASGAASHAEGNGTTASGASSHAEGEGTNVYGISSHAEGYGTIATSNNQHVEGKYNVADANNKFAHIIGNGTSHNARSNAFAIDWDGKIYTNNAATGVDVCTDLQSKIDSTHKLSADLVDDSNSTNKFNVQANWTELSSAAASFIQNKPTLGTASALDVATTGDASTTQVVKGDDTRVLAVTAQQNTTASGGTGYAIINGIRLYANPSGTPPTGDIPDGSYGLF